jgi:hypothetical protein
MKLGIGVSEKMFFRLRLSARQQGKLLHSVQFALFMAAKLLAKHHIFMLGLAGLACQQQRLLRCTLFRSSPCKGRVFSANHRVTVAKKTVVRFFEESGENRRISSEASDGYFVDKRSMFMISGFFQARKKTHEILAPYEKIS